MHSTPKRVGGGGMDGCMDGWSENLGGNSLGHGSKALISRSPCRQRFLNSGLADPRNYRGENYFRGVFFWPAKIGGGEIWYRSLEMKEKFGIRPLVVAS